MWTKDETLLSQMQQATDSIFAVRGDLDGEQPNEFQEREQFIGMIVGDEEFLLPIAAIREIIMPPPITFVPNAPDFVDGVINLRGNIVPAINLRKIMGCERSGTTAATRVIVSRADNVTFGMIVDSITYVVALLPTEIENQALPGTGNGAELIGSIAKHGNRILGILDMARVLRYVGGDASDGDNQSAEDGQAA